MFKGSERFNKESGTAMEELMESKGGMVNATTWFDRTNYFEIIPKDVLPTAIAIEADRMRTARILESDRQSEMPVVRNEFERGENLPMEALDKAMWSAAFIAHPYHHSTIGWRSDIEKVSIERLNEFYDTFYWPDNATLTIAGDFDIEEVLKLAKKEFGRHSKAPKPYPLLYTEEPKQEGQRRVIVKRSGVHMVGIAHKIPEALHADIPALLLLAAILGDGKTSRLHRALVDTAKATDVATYCWQFQEPSLFETFVTMTPDALHADIEAVVMEEYARIATKGVSAAELKRAKNMARRVLADRKDGVYALLMSLNEDIATGDWRHFIRLPSLITAVTAADIKRVAKSYFLEDQSTVGWFINTAV
jgi:zinc protease